MKCLCCGKELPFKPGTAKMAGSWHPSCIRRFFGTSSLPAIDLSDASLIRIAEENTSRKMTIPGIQKKMSLHLSREGNVPRLTIVNYPTGYIVKPQTEQYRLLPEAEYLAMMMAKETGISTVPFALLEDNKENHGRIYITRRIDRILPDKKNPELKQLAMEDFCQLEERLTEDKYHGSYERCAHVISRYSVQPGLDLSELFLRVVFSFVTGNSDMHLKNFSLIETEAGSQNYVLSPAYDILPVSIILPEDNDQMALTVNGKHRNIRRKDLIQFAETSGINPEAAQKIIRKVISMEKRYIELCKDSFLSPDMKERFCELIHERTLVLSNHSAISRI